MNPAFEPVATALLDALQYGSPLVFRTVGRRVPAPSQVPDQPALFLRRVGVNDQGDDPFTITTLDYEAWIYCNGGQDPDMTPDIELACLEQVIREALQPGPADGDGRFTLGGLVYWCRIEGHSEIWPGDIGNQSLACIPIRVTLP